MQVDKALINELERLTLEISKDTIDKVKYPIIFGILSKNPFKIPVICRPQKKLS